MDGVLFSGTTTTETFLHDGATNITARTGPAAAYSHDASNRVTSDGTRSFVWDGADRLTQRGADTFGYDPLARLTSSTVSGNTRTHTYDGDGLLRSRAEGAATTAFLWDGSVAPAPLLVAGSDRVVHGLGPLYLARADGTTLTLVRDALGSVRAEVTDQGVIARAFRYAAYGEIVQPNANAPTLLGFASELRDPTGLVYLRARWYDPGTGRFTSKDPFPGHESSPSSLNAYLYAVGRPTLLLDPMGLEPHRSNWAYDIADLIGDMDNSNPRGSPPPRGFRLSQWVSWLSGARSARPGLSRKPLRSFDRSDRCCAIRATLFPRQRAPEQQSVLPGRRRLEGRDWAIPNCDRQSRASDLEAH